MDEDNQVDEISIEKLQADLDKANNNWKRALADFENFKKQKDKENKELLEFAKEVAVVKLLPTLDTLEQALRHAPEMNHESGIMNHEWGKKYENWLTGINGILSQLDKALGELGVQKIEAIGKKFDPHFHEAVREVESEQADGIILDELQSGFILNGKVIRASQVIISKQVVR